MTPKSSMAKAINRTFGVADYYQAIAANVSRCTILSSSQLPCVGVDPSSCRDKSVQCIIERDVSTGKVRVSTVLIFDDFPFYIPSIDYLLGPQK
ncbi:hypothetical protein CBW52_22640 [Yersinia kristensenii]|uniref:Uncharacterized protein n=1 Tax=Yersinia kristensenii TaxID=28152 RepID=A0AB73Q5L0_YERKR|nr:hypothetical protein CBW52_22640 [Yersinia kristensenii]